MAATHTDTKITFERTYTECADPDFGSVTYTYRESTLGLGSHAYTEVQDYRLANGETSHYQADVIQLRSGQWIIGTTTRAFGSTLSVDKTDLIDADTAWSWIRSWRTQHGFTS